MMEYRGKESLPMIRTVLQVRWALEELGIEAPWNEAGPVCELDVPRGDATITIRREFRADAFSRQNEDAPCSQVHERILFAAESVGLTKSWTWAKLASCASEDAYESPTSNPPHGTQSAALSIYDKIEVVTKDPTARTHLLEALNFRLWLNFGEAKKGERWVRVLKGGIITTGAAALPMRPYGPDGDPADAGSGGNGMLPPADGNGDTETPSVKPKGSRDGVSLTKVHRGDKI